MCDMKNLQKILSRVRLAVERYDMICDGDRIAVGVSGGKDSLTLLCALAELRRFLPRSFALVAVTADMGFEMSDRVRAEKSDHRPVRELCSRLHVPYIVRETELARIIFDVRRESNPCSLCARMRRGLLHDLALEQGCNKVALGHHYDDAVETFMLNLFFEGRVGCFSPVTYLSRKDLTVIRPLVLTEEKEIGRFVRSAGLPVEESPCPADKDSQRAYIKEYLHAFDRGHRGLYRRILGAMERGHIDGWTDV